MAKSKNPVQKIFIQNAGMVRAYLGKDNAVSTASDIFLDALEIF